MATTDGRGFWLDKSGEYRHADLVPADKKLEDQTVETLIAEAKRHAETLADFKARAFEECYLLIDTLRENYGIRLGGQVGNVTLTSYDGCQRVKINVNKFVTFDSKLSLAKEKVDEYLDQKTADSDPEIRTLITKAFEVKSGKVDAKRIFSLKSYAISHPTWKEAMALIDEATEIAGTKSYIRFEERVEGQDDKWTGITLDIAAIQQKKKAEGEING